MWHWGGRVHTLSQLHSQEGQEWKSLSMGQLPQHVQSTGDGSSERSPFGSQKEPSVHTYSKHTSLQPLCQLLHNLFTYWLCFAIALLPLPFDKFPPHQRFHHGVGLSRRNAEGGLNSSILSCPRREDNRAMFTPIVRCPQGAEEVLY